MYKCQDFTFVTNWLSNLRKHEKFMHKPLDVLESDIKPMYKCHDCSYSTNYLPNLRKHQKSMHKESELKEIYIDDTLNQPNHNMYDVRLKENFKVFISGPSRCGKTVFVSNLLEKINEFAKMPPTKVIYVYKVWQPKYDEMLSLGVNFKVDHDNIVDDIKSLSLIHI